MENMYIKHILFRGVYEPPELGGVGIYIIMSYINIFFVSAYTL